jgi:hypothetical protein
VPGGRSASLWQTVCGHRADSPLPTGGRSVSFNKRTRRALQHAYGPYLVHGQSASNWCRADGPRRPGGWSTKHLPAKNSWPTGSKHWRSITHDEHEEPYSNRLRADGPHLPSRQSARCEHAREQQPERKPASTSAPILPWISQTA